MRDWLTTMRLLWELRRANRRALLHYARFGPSAGLDADGIRALYADFGATLARSITGGNRR